MDRAKTVASDRSSTVELLAALRFQRGHMRRSLQEALRAAIQSGELAAGSRLPASRVLAAEMAVSRGVVTDTYDQLASEGYLRVAARSAPVVATVAHVIRPRPEPEPSRWPVDFIATTPEVALFPRHLWTRAVERALRDAPDATLDYGDHRGSIALRQALSGYLVRVRGVRIDPARILIVQGFTQGLDLLCRVLRRRGARTVAIESPSLPPSWSTIRSAGLRLVGRAVDDGGLVVRGLSSFHADAIVVTPAHQFPTGAVMAADRRVAVLEWAARRDAFVIEDDYDAEFRFDRQPVGALQGLDPARVVHIGTASKTLVPGIRLGWMSVPADLVDELRAEKGDADSGSPAIDQLALARLLADGDYERHVAKMRQVYRSRRDELRRALADSLPSLSVRGAVAGMHILVALPAGADDVGISRRAASNGIRVSPLSPMYLTRPARPGLLLGYGRLQEETIAPGVRALAKVLAAER
jgi:GntR family transcriptional regulator/MocR family aminotransferase